MIIYTQGVALFNFVSLQYTVDKQSAVPYQSVKAEVNFSAINVKHVQMNLSHRGVRIYPTHNLKSIFELSIMFMM